MKYQYVILGAGRQGVALAYDLARNGEAAKITLADSDGAAVTRAIDRLRALLASQRCELVGSVMNVTEGAAVTRALRGASVAISAVPYRFNVELTDAAILAGVHFCDLGGNTAVVRKQLSRHARALSAGVSIVPDCGLAPGLGNILAAHGVASMSDPQHVHVRCGGLPQRRVGPLGYKLVFNFQGLVNEYSGAGEFLRDGRKVEIPALTELEEIEFPAPLGKCEAAVTSGGTSTCSDSFAGRLQSYDYKTVRYPGHFALVRALFELGCFEEKLVLRGGGEIEPKSLMQRLFEERLAYPEVRDLVVLRATILGADRGRPRTLRFDLFDRHDEATGFTAMERTTAFPTALVAHMQARGVISPGAQPLEKCVPTAHYLEELPRHDIRVACTED